MSARFRARVVRVIGARASKPVDLRHCRSWPNKALATVVDQNPDAIIAQVKQKTHGTIMINKTDESRDQKSEGIVATSRLHQKSDGDITTNTSDSDITTNRMDASCNETSMIIVRGIAGNVLLGPRAMPVADLLMSLQSELLSDRPYQRLWFTLNGVEVKTDYVFAGLGDIELVAGFASSLDMQFGCVALGNDWLTHHFFIKVVPEEHASMDPNISTFDTNFNENPYNPHRCTQTSDNVRHCLNLHSDIQPTETIQASLPMYDLMVRTGPAGSPQKAQVFNDFITAKEGEAVTFKEIEFTNAKGEDVFQRKIHVTGHFILIQFKRNMERTNLEQLKLETTRTGTTLLITKELHQMMMIKQELYQKPPPCGFSISDKKSGQEGWELVTHKCLDDMVCVSWVMTEDSRCIRRQLLLDIETKGQASI